MTAWLSHNATLLISVGMIVFGLVLGLCKSSAEAERRYHRMIDEPIEKTREAMARPLPQRPYRPGTVR